MSESCGIARLAPGRSFLRPPTVNRKSHSFNAADRNKIKEIPTRLNYGTSGRSNRTTTAINKSMPPTNSASIKPGPRSSSLNAKHHFTTKLVQSNTVQNAAKKAAKPSTKPAGSKQSLVRVDNGKVLQQNNSNSKQRLVKMKKPAVGVDTLSVSEKKPSRLAKPKPTAGLDSSKNSSKLQMPASKFATGKSKIASPSNTLKKPRAQNSSNSPSVKNDKCTTPNGVKSTSMLGRLKKLGSPSTSTSSTIPDNYSNGITLKHATPVKSPSQDAITKPLSSAKKEKRLPVPKNNASKLLYKASPSKTSGKQSGIKSTFQRTFGGSKESDKENEQQRPEISAPIGEPKGFPKYKDPPMDIVQKLISDNLNNNTTVNDKQKLVKIDVNNLLVPPYESNFSKCKSLPASSDNDDDDSSLSLSNSIENGNKFLRQNKPFSETPVSPRPNHLGVRNVQLPSSSDERDPEKIATVAPFFREVGDEDDFGECNGTAIEVASKSDGNNLKNAENIPSLPDKRPSITVNSNATDEERRETAKGIADLRQNLENTMSTLRSSQLRNRLSDDFERRISAQLELEEIALPEVPPLLLSSNGYQTIQLGSRMPKLHAGEEGTDSFSTARMSLTYSSLQRVRKPAWEEMSQIKSDKSEVSISDDLSSVSSGDISEFMEGMSTDGLSSTTNSPHHCVASKARPNLPLSETLHNRVMNNLHIQSPTEQELIKNDKKLKAEMKSNSWKKNKKADKKKSETSIESLQQASPAVGSRLAMIERSESPCGIKTSSPYTTSTFDMRGGLAYRSLPRPKKSVMGYNEIKSNRSSKCGSIGDLIEEERETIDAELKSTATNSFVRSPSLKILLRSKAKKKQVQERCENKDTTDYISQTIYDGSSKNVEMYNGKKHKSFSSITAHSLLSNTQSLPRHFSARNCNGTTTWSSPRNKLNTAYSLPVTPGENDKSDALSMYDTMSSNVDQSFTNLTVPDYNNFTDALHTSYQTSVMKPKAFKSDSLRAKADYRHASSTHDLLSLSSKRDHAASSKPQRSSYSAAEADAKSIETATNFLYTLAKNRASESAAMVEEFESSLLHLTNRLRELSESADVKDKELNELKETIKRIKDSPDTSPESDLWQDVNLRKKPSCTSLCSMNSQTSLTSSIEEDGFKKKKKHWFRNSFRSAFGKNKSKSRTNLNEECVSPSKSEPRHFSNDSTEPDTVTVHALKTQLMQKEQKLTDIRLEALTSQHQLQHMQDTMAKMRAEMEKLKQENESLHRIGLSSYPYATLKMTKQSKQIRDSLKNIKTELNLQIKVSIPHYRQSTAENIIITAADISVAINWIELDEKIKALFVGYCHTIDPSGSLGLNEDSVYSYTVGSFERKFNSATPTDSPKDYLNESVKSIEMKILDCRSSSVDSLSFELLIDKNIVAEYVDLLETHKSVVISGSIGTGKSLLANRLAGYIAGCQHGKVVHLDAKLKEASEMRDFLKNLTSNFDGTSDKCAETTAVILDNISHLSLLQTLFEPLLNVRKQPPKNLYFICVLPHCDESTLSCHQFQWIVFSNTSQPVQTQLTRKLRRAYIENQINNHQTADDLLSIVILWLPKCCQHLNNCLESFGEEEASVGPRMFSTCPMDAASSRVWFADVWNYNVVPYVARVIKASIKRMKATTSEVTAKWNDPTLWVKETMPWDDLELLYIKITDIVLSPGTDSEISITSQQSHITTSSSSDPLLNMLMRLQEAANYDSDTSSSHDVHPLDH